MHYRSFHTFASACIVVLSLCSCAGTRFYQKVDGQGVIVGRPCIEWKKPDRFVYVRSKNPVFSFKRSNGEVIKPGSIETDGGSIPHFLWAQRGFSPWTYAPAYLIHDWLYEARRRKVPAGVDPKGNDLYYTKEQADWIMAEVIKSQMERPSDFDTKKSSGHLRTIYWAVSKFGNTAWNGEAHPIDEGESFITDTLQNLPLLPALGSLKDQLTPMPAKPEQKGSRTPQE